MLSGMVSLIPTLLLVRKANFNTAVMGQIGGCVWKEVNFHLGLCVDNRDLYYTPIRS